MNIKIAFMGFFAIAILALAGCSGPLEKGYSWRCSAVQCAEFMDGVTWAEKYCLPNGNQTVCPVIVDGAQLLVPIESINLSAVQQCSRFVCVEEQLFRSVNYTINVTTG